MMTFGLPLAMQAFHRVVERPTWGAGVWLGASLAIQALACAYFGIFAGLTVGLGTLYYGYTRGLWRVRAYWVAIALGAVVSVGLVGPFFLPYIRVQKELGFTRLLEDAAMYSADWQAWLASSAWAHRWMLPWLGRWNEVLFPGFLLTALGAAGLLVGLRSTNAERRTPNDDRSRSESRSRCPIPDATPLAPSRRRETTVFYGLVALIAFWASFGPKACLYTVALPHHSGVHVPAGARPVRHPRGAGARRARARGGAGVARIAAARVAGAGRRGARRACSQPSTPRRRFASRMPRRHQRHIVGLRRCRRAPSSNCRSGTYAPTSRDTRGTCCSPRITGIRW